MGFRTTMKGEKSTATSSKMFTFNATTTPRLAVRILQFTMALTVCGLYGHDLNNARLAHKYADSKWVYAVVVAGLSAITSIVMIFPLVKSWWFAWWDAVLFLMWLIVFGIFGKMYIPEDAEGSKGVQRMKNAVWVDLVNMLLWFGTAGWGAFVWWRARRERSLFTSRAEV